jgi:predicted aspartyl protease
MITGFITVDREAVFRLIVYGPDGEEEAVEATIDTGFNGYLTLPPFVVSLLGLAYHSEALALLGDGSTVSLHKFEATVLWDGQDREVLVLEAEGVPLPECRCSTAAA